MEIIPAIDIIGGKCARLLKGDYEKQSIYEKTPVEMAKYFESCKADRIHVVDLDGAINKKLTNGKVIAEICEAVTIPVEVGGGVRTKDDIKTLFSLGVRSVVIGSLAVSNSDIVEQFIRSFGSEGIIIGIDVLNGTPRISGWVEDSELSIEELIEKMINIGVTIINYTDISRDGTLTSPNFEKYSELLKSYPKLKIVASGGVSSLEDVQKLRDIGVAGVIIGKAIYENKINLRELC